MATENQGGAMDLVKAFCEEFWPRDKSDCSAFVRDVADAMGVTLAGNADTIVNTIRHKWHKLPNGVAAKAAAEAGTLVIAGLRGDEQAEPSEHGHVVVVVGGALDHGKYPTGYWGRLGGVGERNKTINYAWRTADRDKVTYAVPPA